MKLSLFLAFFITIFCSNIRAEDIKQLPSWYIAPKASDVANLYGTGEGYDLAEASKSALNNLAGKLMTNISSESSVILESNNYGTNEQSHQKINQEVAKITFSNYKISNSSSFNGKMYIEISVNRDDFITEYSQKLDGLNKKMADIFSLSQSKTILEKLNDLELVNNLTIEARLITQILFSLGINQESLKNKVELYNSYQNSYQNLIGKIEFFIDKNSVPKSLVSGLIQNLNNKKLKVVKNKNLNNANLVIIRLEYKLLEQEIYGSNIAKITVNFNLLSNDNKIIKSSVFEASGTSAISKEQAVLRAIANISQFDLF